MKTISHELIGPVSFQEDTKLMGMIQGNLEVKQSAKVYIQGMVTGDVTVREGCVLEVNGMITGTLYNEGAQVSVFGMVGNIINLRPESPAHIDAKAVITGL